MSHIKCAAKHTTLLRKVKVNYKQWKLHFQLVMLGKQEEQNKKWGNKRDGKIKDLSYNLGVNSLWLRHIK